MYAGRNRPPCPRTLRQQLTPVTVPPCTMTQGYEVRLAAAESRMTAALGRIDGVESRLGARETAAATLSETVVNNTAINNGDHHPRSRWAFLLCDAAVAVPQRAPARVMSAG